MIRIFSIHKPWRYFSQIVNMNKLSMILFRYFSNFTCFVDCANFVFHFHSETQCAFTWMDPGCKKNWWMKENAWVESLSGMKSLLYSTYLINLAKYIFFCCIRINLFYRELNYFQKRYALSEEEITHWIRRSL